MDFSDTFKCLETRTGEGGKEEKEDGEEGER